MRFEAAAAAAAAHIAKTVTDRSGHQEDGGVRQGR